MKNCSTCNTQISFKTRFKTFWLGYKDIECPSCGMKFKHTMRNRILGGITAGFAPFMAYVLMNYTQDDAYLVATYSLVLTVLFGLLMSILFAYFFSFQPVAK